MKTLSQNEQDIRTLIQRMEEVQKTDDTDSYFRLASELERKVMDLCQILFRAIERDNQDEMAKAAEFERLFISRVQATLGTKGQVITGLVTAAISLGGVGISSVGIMKANAGIQRFGEQVSQASKVSEIFGKFIDNSNEAERVGHQHDQKVAGTLVDAYRQAINEYNQAKHRNAQMEAETERSRSQAISSIAPAA